MSFHKTYGKVMDHAVSRLMKQYDFKGSEREARKLLRSCSRKVDGSTGRVIISVDNTGFPEEKFKQWNIPSGKLIAIVNFGNITSVLNIAQ